MVILKQGRTTSGSNSVSGRQPQFSASTASSRLRRSSSLNRSSSSGSGGMDATDHPKITLDKAGKKVPSQHPPPTSSHLRKQHFGLNVPSAPGNVGSSALVASKNGTGASFSSSSRASTGGVGVTSRPFQRKTSRNSLSSNSSVSSQTTEESSGLASTTLPSMTSSCSSTGGGGVTVTLGRRRSSAGVDFFDNHFYVVCNTPIFFARASENFRHYFGPHV